MHRFRKKVDLKKQRLNQLNDSISENIEGDNTQPPSSSNIPYTELPSDFRTSLILPKLTQRFSVLRRGEIMSTPAAFTTNTTSSDNMVKSIVVENGSKTNTGTVASASVVKEEISIANNNSIGSFPRQQLSSNGDSNMNSGQSPLSNVYEDDVSMSNSLSSLSSTPPTSINTNSLVVNDDINISEISNARKFYGASAISNANYRPYPEQNSVYDSSQPSTSSHLSPVVITDLSTTSDVKSPTKFNYNNIDEKMSTLGDQKKNHPKLRSPPVFQNTGEHTWSKAYSSSTISSSDHENLQSHDSLTKFLTNGDGIRPPPSPRSPLDQLSDGLMNLSLHSMVDSSSVTTIGDEDSSLSNNNLSKNSLFRRSVAMDEPVNVQFVPVLEENQQPNLNFAPEVPSTQKTITANNAMNSKITRKLVHSKSLSSIYSVDRDSSSPSTVHSPLRVMNLRNSNSSGGTFGTSFSSSPLTPDKSYDGDYEVDDNVLQSPGKVHPTPFPRHREGNARNVRESSEVMSQYSVSSAETQAANVVIETPIKRPLRNAVAPPKPQPPPLSLTDTLIASGQSDIAHQVMVMRRAQNSGHNSSNLIPKNSSSKRSKQKKNPVLKNISSPQLVSTSSNVKAVPIVTIGNEEEKNGKFRRKFSLRDNEGGLGKSLKRIKDAFTNDNEVNRTSIFGKKPKNIGKLSPNSSTERLPKKFVSEEDLNQLYIKDKKGMNFVKRRAFSTREHRPNESLRQDIRNNFTFIMDERSLHNSGYSDELVMDNNSVRNNIHNFNTSSEENVSTAGSYWNMASDSDIIEDPNPKKVAGGRQPLYDIDALKRHAEMVTGYSSNKRDQNSSRLDSHLVRTSSLSTSGGSLSGRDSSSTSNSIDRNRSRDLLMSGIREEEIDQSNSDRLSYDPQIPTPKLKVDIPTESAQSIQSPPTQSENSDNKWGIMGSESNPTSPLSPYSPISATSNSPPPILPRNPLRNLNSDKNRPFFNRTMPLNRNGSLGSVGTSGSDDRRDSKDSKTSSSSRLMSLFNSYSSSRSSKSSKSSRNSKNSEVNYLQVPSSHTSMTEDTMQQEDESTAATSKKQNRVVRRTIIITKPNLPTLPEVEPSGIDVPSSPSTKSLDNKPTETNPEGDARLSSDGRNRFLFKKRHSNGSSADKDRASMRSNPDDSNVSMNKSSDSVETRDTNNHLSVPSERTSWNRPPTPIPPLSARESIVEPPYGIPIPPIPLPHRQSVASKRASRSSTISAHSTSSKYRKSIGGKSIQSSYGESLYDYYNYSDAEGADDEGEEDKNIKRKTGVVDSSQWSAIRDKEFDNEDFATETGSVIASEQQLVEVLEMDDGSFVWQVVEMDDRFSHYYDGGSDDDGQLWSRDLYSEEDLNDDDERSGHMDYLTYGGVLPSPLHLPGALPDRKSYMSEISMNEDGSVHEEQIFVPRTSVYFAKDVPLAKLLEEMSRGLGGMENDYLYDGEMEMGGIGFLGDLTVEEKLEQVMKTLGVNDRDVLY
ncbi:14783_t:CDS:2 [Acaulospora morrowiae]|uniref:14783_t:CDS:1 n=1 Tax=Acaulospora morrowiae TaxID=94023 RepID=A0A9N8WLE1_9GLOM|nr:14783_t:CDS:2 [Acaulospora morrowiae]